ncbi:ABC transporter permease [Alicyclobacillus macrosporangiidus]|uniref:ABC transporter permease n=1 Tax=Alicyclobacillus macrosporangiidus TaxID=392015 RepID=UPI0006896964|nr:ABC transporter permease [Alicyclobacillus macrosporangiidus]
MTGRRALAFVRNNRLAFAALLVILAMALAALFAPWLAPYPGDAHGQAHSAEAFQPPSARHPFGTDSVGRDLLSLVLFGGRISLSAGLIAIVCALCIGVPLGLVAGYAGGWVDEVIMRFTDVVLSFPALLLAVAISALLGPSLTNAILAIALSWWPWYTRLVRSQVAVVRTAGFVEAAILAGQPRAAIVTRHVLPNALTPIIVQASMDLGSVILTLAGLSFLGMGAQPPSAEWGLLVSQGRSYILSDWWYVTFPGLAILVAAGALNMVGDGLRDVLDPRQRGAYR